MHIRLELNVTSAYLVTYAQRRNDLLRVRCDQVEAVAWLCFSNCIDNTV